MELLMYGTFWFWAVVAVEILLLALFYEYENGIAATVSAIVFIALLQYGSKIDVFGWAMAHPWNLLSIVGVYFAFGVVWGMFKWRLFVGECAREYEDEKAKWLEQQGYPNEKVVPESLRAKWVKHLEDIETRDYLADRRLDETPLVRKNKARITRWMSMWVISLLFALLHDAMKEAFAHLYCKIAGYLQHMANSQWAKGNAAKDTELPK